MRGIQEDLRRHGISVAIGGDYGPATERAVRTFQDRYGLTIDGKSGRTTQRALEGGIQYLRQGSSGVAVRRLQGKLASAGFLNGAIDGEFGPGTARAVRAFQASEGLDADGIVGPSTFNALK